MTKYVVTTVAIDSKSKTLVGTDHLVLDHGATLRVNGVAVKMGVPAEQLVIDNGGTIESVEANGRAINLNGAVEGHRTLILTNGPDAVIRAENDAIRINVALSDAIVTINNAGTILSWVSGQAIDFDAIATAPKGGITIANAATGRIEAVGSDAIRPGNGTSIVNAGTILAGGVIGDKNDGVDWQANTGTVHNLSGGLISGQRHGITSSTFVDVVNDAGGVIIGRNGSGVGSDGGGRVVNYGRITGAYVGEGSGDGDGVDIDGSGTIDNYGIIEGTGGDGSVAEGALITGGGVINNYRDASITGIVRGVTTGYGTVVNNAGSIAATGSHDTYESSDGIGGFYGGRIVNAATGKISGDMRGVFVGGGFDIVNDGLVKGAFQGILLLGNSENSVRNTGTIVSGFTGVQAQGGHNLIVNDGGITGTLFGILLEGGTNTLTLGDTSIVSGAYAGVAALGPSTNVIRNAGLIDGNLVLNDGADVVENSGVIRGGVVLGAGDDRFTLADGTVGGVIDGGAGYDIFTIDGVDSMIMAAERLTGFEEIVQRGTGTVTYDGRFDVDTVRLERGRMVIASDGVIHAGSEAAIAGGDFAIGIDNRGIVTGTILLGEGDDVVVNSGRIIGDLMTGKGDDTIVDRGIVSGLIDMGEGDDVLHLAATTVILHPIAGGSGDDRLIVESGTETGAETEAGRGAHTLSIHGDMMTSFEHVLTMEGVALLFEDGKFVFDNMELSGDLTIASGAEVGAAAIKFGSGDNVVTVAGKIAGPIDGGDGIDTIGFAGALHGVTVAEGHVGADPNTLWVTGFERIMGSGLDDAFLMSANRTGVSISAGGGNDLLIGGSGDDVLDGGAGVDRTAYQSFSWQIALSQGKGEVDVATAEFGADRLRSVEYIQFKDGYFTTDTDSNAAKVTRAYLAIADRQPTAVELEAGANALDHGSPLATLVATLAKTAGNGLGIGVATVSDSQFIDAAYAKILGREADQGGKDAWIAAIGQGKSRERIAANLIESHEFRSVADDKIGGMLVLDDKYAQITSLYHAIGRLPDRDGFNYWSARLDAGSVTIRQMSEEFVHSPEWIHRMAGLQNSQIVEDVYRSALGREADGNGKAFWTESLDHGLSQAQLLRAFSGSDEHHQIMHDITHGSLMGLF